MSPRDWSDCPVCKLLSQQTIQQAKDRLATLYGVIPVDEYERKLKQLETETRYVFESNTLREDYEIGININGQFSVDYYCSCERCNFEYHFLEGRQVEINKNDFKS